jgi:subfamily B ATP-binding cassette protein MsbA
MSDRPSAQWPLISRILRQGWEYRWLAGAMLLTTVAVTALTGYQGKLFKDLLDALTAVQHGGNQRQPIFTILFDVLRSAFFGGNGNESLVAANHEVQRVALIMLALALPLGLLSYSAWLTGQYLANRCMRDLRSRFVAHLVRLDLSFHGELARGELLSRVTADLDRLYSVQSMLFGKFIQRPALALGYIAAVFWASWQIGLAVFIVLVPIGAIIARILRKTRHRSQRAQETLAATLIAFEQITGGIRVIKTMGSTEREVTRYSGLNQDLYGDRQRVARARAQSEGITQGSVLLMAGGAMFLASLLFIRGWITPSDLLVSLTFVGLLIGALRELQKVWGDIQENLPAAERVYAILDRQPTLVDRPQAPALAAPQRAIRLEDVSFRYAANSEAVIEHIDLLIPVGRTTALVGPSGGGKSTLLDLIPRLRDVSGGRITWDGTDIREVQADSLIRHVAIVSQDSFLFNDTVRANIRYGKPGASDAEVEQAARRAHVHDAILSLEGGQGYDTVVGDRGGRLSGGQRQRVAIARALLRDAPILLLDEPTSALDATSEQHVQEALDELMKNRTTVVIAHRLATVQHADCIHVIGKRGPGPSQVLESGTHAELVAKNGEYAELVRLQQLG